MTTGILRGVAGPHFVNRPNTGAGFSTLQCSRAITARASGCRQLCCSRKIGRCQERGCNFPWPVNADSSLAEDSRFSDEGQSMDRRGRVPSRSTLLAERGWPQLLAGRNRVPPECCCLLPASFARPAAGLPTFTLQPDCLSHASPRHPTAADRPSTLPLMLI